MFLKRQIVVDVTLVTTLVAPHDSRDGGGWLAAGRVGVRSRRGGRRPGRISVGRIELVARRV